MSDGVFWSKGLLYCINIFISDGRIFLAENFLYSSFFFIKKTLNSSGIFFFLDVLEKIKPIVGLKLYILKTNTLINTDIKKPKTNDIL